MNRLPAICHIITTMGGGGAERQLAELVAASPPSEFEHHVIALSGRYPAHPKLEQAARSLQCLDLGRNWPSGARGILRLAAALRRIRPDLVHTWMYHADLLGTLAAKLTGQGPLLWYLQASNLDLGPYGRGTALVRRACKWLSRWPQAVVANSQAGLAAHRALGYANRRMLVIPNGFDTELFRPDDQARQQMRARLGLGEEHLLVGMVARLDPVKDHAGFLAAASRAAAEDERMRFLLLGRGVEQDQRLWALSQEPILAGRCHLLGHSDQVHRWLPALDLHVSSSLSEGLPNVVGEAMAAGLINVVTEVGDSACLVGDTGRAVPPRDPRAMAGAMRELLGLPPGERRQMGQAARRRIEENYSLSRLTTDFGRLYRELLASSRLS